MHVHFRGKKAFNLFQLAVQTSHISPLVVYWEIKAWYISAFVMTLLQAVASSHRNDIHITGLFCRENNYQWIPITNGLWCGHLMFSLMQASTSCWTNSWVTNDLQCLNTNVISLQWWFCLAMSLKWYSTLFNWWEGHLFTDFMSIYSNLVSLDCQCDSDTGNWYSCLLWVPTIAS